MFLKSYKTKEQSSYLEVIFWSTIPICSVMFLSGAHTTSKVTYSYVESVSLTNLQAK